MPWKSCLKSLMKIRTIEVVVRILFIELGVLSICRAQNAGFVSVDCGKEGPDYVDGVGIFWRNDSTVTDIGVNGAINGSFSQFSWPLNSTLRDFRYFPEPRPKQCYALPVLEDATYIVRAMFLHGGHPALQLPMSFDVSINATLWTSLQFDDSNPSAFGFTKPVVKEGVIYSEGTVLYVCLLPRLGSPFISSLELRHIDVPNTMSPFDHMLNHDVLNGKFMRDGIRFNCGADLGTPSIRYPDDSMDRIWEAPELTNITHPGMKDPRGTVLNSTENAIVPFKVMQDAWGANDQFNMSFGYQVARGNGFYAFVSTKELNASASIRRGMKISLNVDGVTSFPNATGSVIPNLVRHVNATANLHRLELITALPTNWSGLVSISWEREEWSNVGPIVNGLEVYTVDDWDASSTGNKDLAVLEVLRTGLNLTRWHFDPCFPVPERWIECNVTSGTVVKINVTGPRLPFDLSNSSLNTLLWSLDSLETVVMDRSNVSFLDLSLWHESLRRIEAGGLGSSIKLFSLVNSSVSTITPAFSVLAGQISRMLCSPYANALKGGILLGGNPFCQDAQKFLGEQFLQRDIEMAYRYLCRFSQDEMPASDMRFCSTGSENSGVGKHVIIVVSTTTGALTLLSICICLGTIWKMWKQKNTLDEIERALAEQKVQPRFYSFNELKIATNDFHQNMRLGKGAFGEVYKGELEDGTIVAVKKLYHSKQMLDEFLNEVVLITGIKHRNLIQLKGCCIKAKQRILVYDFADNKNLAEALWDTKRPTRIFLNWQQRFNVCLGIARGLSYLHEELQPRIIHRDIKPANILLDRLYNPKIADFGLARPLLDEQTRLQSVHLAGTLGYFSPEYATQGQLTEKADVFSYGVLVLEIVSGRKCIDYNMPSEQIFLVNWAQDLYEESVTSLLELLDPELRAHWEVDEFDVTRVIKIGLACLQIEPTRRPPMSLVVTMLLGNMDVMELSDLRNRANQVSFGSLLRDSRLPYSSSESFTDFSVEAEHKQTELPLFTTISRRDSSITYHFDHRVLQSSSLPPAATMDEFESYEAPLNPSSVQAEVELSRGR